MDPLDHLPGLASGALWRADALAPADGAVRPSGHPPLDAQLPGGGWPTGSLIELLLDAPGHGEWRLLAPVLAAAASTASPDTRARTSAARANAAWASPTPSASPSRSRARLAPVETPPLAPWLAIGPPLQPHGAALQALGLDLAQGLWITPRHDLDAAWAAEQALRAGSCAAVLCWTAEADAPLPTTALRRLHLAAQGRGALLFLLRPSHRVSTHAATPAPLRLHSRIDPLDPARLQLRILKRRGPPLAEALSIDTRAQLAPALAHRLSLPLPQHRPMPETTPTTVAPPATFTLDARVAALLARARLAEASLDDAPAEPHGPRP